jgi:chromosome segregation protein
LQEEKHLQEKQFNKKINTNKIIDIENRIKQGDEEKARLLRQLDEIVTMLNAAKMEGLQQSLQTAVIDKQEKEKKLVEVRDAMAQFEQTLQDRERFRIQIEQLIHPMRDKLEQARLLEQEMRLNFERCQNRLSELDIEESLLLQEMPNNARALQWEEQTQQIQLQIDALGAVNLAAIQELESEVQRKQYLDSQASDLEQAISTLEDAIVKIDRETRSRLQSTYDETNRHFGDLFKDLFGGGQAKLELLGAEILDSGVQVFAQPPGKKNSTIHLLSGGEKALTALALVFALFKLNPAPFCLMDEVDAPLDDSNTVRFCEMVKKMSERTQFLFVSHNKITMEMAQQLIGVTMQESGVSRVVEVDMDAAMKMQEPVLAELN